MPDPNIDLAFMNGKMHANSLARFQQALLAKVHDVSGAVETSFTPLHKITFTPDTFPIISTVGCCSKQSRAPIVPDLVFARCVSRLALGARGNRGPVERSFRPTEARQREACNNKRGIETGAKHRLL